MGMIKLFRSGLLVVLLLSGCGWNGTPTRGPEGILPLTSIEIVAEYTTIAKDTSTRLKAYGYYSGVRREITDQVAWSSGSPAVADFTTGIPSRVKGLAPGTSLLTATLDSVSANLPLTVSNATIQTMTITPAAPSALPKGRTTQFAVSGTFSDLTTQDLTFDAAWSSNDTAVVTVSDDPSSKGLAKAVAATGSAMISATFPSAGGADSVSGTVTLTVTDPVVDSIAVTPANPSVLSLSTTTFKATGTYSDGTTGDLTASATWSSSLPAIATVGAGGGATTISQGSTLIRASQDGASGATSLKVTGGNLTGIAIAPADIRLVTGTSVRMTATGTFSNGATRDITGAVGWSVADSTIANVLPAGGNLAWLNALTVTPLLNPTTVSATYNTLVTTTRLTVDAPTLQSITISPASLDLTTGTSGRFTVTGNFSGGRNQDVTYNTTWTSDSSGIAAVGTTGTNKGRVNGVSSGSTSINAVYGGLTVAAPVTVTARTIDTLTISGDTLLKPAGKQVNFTATALYIGGTRTDVTEDAVWSLPTDKPYVAILADSAIQPGQVIGVDTGSSALTAIFNGKTVSATVTVP
jgi:hypothetical protein